ncbi:HlyD family secretion protein [Francisellaceae bacterium]|nr:HlyD family secretion protein [Francisellaceae bacterium]
MKIPFKKITLTNTVVVIGLVSFIIYAFSFIFPITDDAFVVNNVRPVVAEVSGYVTEIYIKNGQEINKGDPLFKVLDEPYRYNLEKLESKLKQAKAELKALEHQLQKDVNLSQSRKLIYEKIALDDEMFQGGLRAEVVSEMVAKNSRKDTMAAMADFQSSLSQIRIDEHKIIAIQHEIDALEADVKKAQFYLDQTIVYAQQDGIIQNFYLAIGNPVNFNEPVFSFVTTDEIIIQANFRETDLRLVEPGDKVLIFPRTYLFEKVFHGEIISGYWAANRQKTDARTQLQNVKDENQWLLLPQRLPVQIRITDPDPEYPLRVGSSAYVYIEV